MQADRQGRAAEGMKLVKRSTAKGEKRKNARGSRSYSGNPQHGLSPRPISTKAGGQGIAVIYGVAAPLKTPLIGQVRQP